MDVVLVLIVWVWVYLGMMVFLGCLLTFSVQRQHAELEGDPQEDERLLQSIIRSLLLLALACLGGPLWFLSKKVRQRWSLLEE